MKADPRVLARLEEALQAEIAALNVYFVNAKLQRNWGYERLAEKMYEESVSEMKHAEKIVDRIVYFEKVPNMAKMGRLRIGKTVTEQFEIGLSMEKDQLARLNEGCGIARDANDDGTRLIFEPMIAAGEETIDWLETQLALIEQLGEAAYLAEQLA